MASQQPVYTNQPRSGQGGDQMQWRSHQRPVGCPPGLEYMAQIDQILVHEQVDPLIATTGVIKDRGTNKYHLKNSAGQEVYFVYEESEFYQRHCCGKSRGFTMHIMDNLEQEVIRIIRPFKCCAGCCCCATPDGSCSMELHVESPPGQVVGYVKQTKSCWGPRFTVLDGNQQKIMTITGPGCPCQEICCTGDINYPVFHVASQDGHKPAGKIAKQWGGMQREFTNARSFCVEFPNFDVKQKALLIAATFLIDFMYFERAKRTRRVHRMTFDGGSSSVSMSQPRA